MRAWAGPHGAAAAVGDPVVAEGVVDDPLVAEAVVEPQADSSTARARTPRRMARTVTFCDR